MYVLVNHRGEVPSVTCHKGVTHRVVRLTYQKDDVRSGASHISQRRASRTTEAGLRTRAATNGPLRDIAEPAQIVPRDFDLKYTCDL